MTKKEIKNFFDTQLAAWELARRNCSDLQRAELREGVWQDCRLAVQFNPARMVSTGAAIDRKTIEQRPCFLCAKNRPPEQVAVPMLGHYELLVNPFPILPLHFTLPSTLHEPQHIRTTFIDMMRMTALLPGLFLFYNGPRCGASAPDHLHFQAGQRGIVPVERDFGLLYRPKGCGEGVFPLCGYVVNGWVIVAKSAEESEKLFGTLYDTMPQDNERGEPMMNVLAWYEEEEGTYISLILPRCKHRPDCYWAEGVEKCLVSPGALDMGGLVITPRKEDFERMTPERLVTILREVGL